MTKRKQGTKQKPIATPAPTQSVLSAPVPLPPAQTLPSDDEIRQKQREADDKHYETYRAELVEQEQKQAESFDKWILTLAGIALTFSLSFVKDFIKPTSNSELRGIGFLYASWIMFGLPLALIMFNLQVSYSAYKKYRKIVDTHMRAYDKSTEFWNTVNGEMKRVKRNHLVEVFNWASLWLFLFGIASLVIFVWKNCEVNMSDKPVQPPAGILQSQPLDIRSTGTPHEPRVPTTVGQTQPIAPPAKPQK